jgi:hypothetical protein
MFMDELDFEVAPRFVFLGESIVSDWRNPLATTSRAVMRALGELGFEATFLEPRRNRATVGLLSQRGASPVLAFNGMWTDLQYRTVDLPARHEVGPWSGQFAATSGVVAVLEGMPEMIARGLGEFDGIGVDVLVERPELEGDWGRTVLHRFGRTEESIGFRPAVLPQSWTEPRSGMLLVAYDDAELARMVADRVPGARRIVCGSADLPDWEFIPEMELPPLYGAVERVLVIDDGERPIAPARVWLPRANGALAWGIVRSGSEEVTVAVSVDEFNEIWERDIPELPERFDARWVARGLVDMYRFRSDGER